jgi:hypothetical protein
MTMKNFIAEIKSQGLARTNRFAVLCTPPNNVNPAGLRKAMLFCDQAVLPGMNYSTVQNRSFGEVREVPYERLFDTVQLTFHVDKDMMVKSLFDTWMMSIQNPITRNFAYYNEYTSPLIIEVQDLTENTRYEVTLYEAYPKTISSINMSNDSKETMKLTVTFQYKYWTSSTIQQIGNGQKISTNLIDKFRSNFTGFQKAVNDTLGDRAGAFVGRVGEFGAGMAVQSAMKAFSSVTSRIPAIKF